MICELVISFLGQGCARHGDLPEFGKSPRRALVFLGGLVHTILLTRGISMATATPASAPSLLGLRFMGHFARLWGRALPRACMQMEQWWAILNWPSMCPSFFSHVSAPYAGHRISLGDGLAPVEYDRRVLSWLNRRVFAQVASRSWIYFWTTKDHS